MKIAKRYELVPLDKIIPYARNPRNHSKEQVAQIRASFREFGVLSPCLVDENYSLLCGHGRLEAARAEGLAEINCVVAEGLTEAQKKAYLIADNKLTENSDWETDLLALEFADLKDLGFSLELTGFDANEIEKLFAAGSGDIKDDDFDLSAALEKAAFVLPGDLWVLGRHRLMCGDSTKSDDVARLMDGKKANMCLTDVPYNVDYNGKAGKILNDKMSKEQYYQFLLAAFRNIYDNVADGGAFYCFHADSEKVNVFNACVDAGFHYSTTCIWVKDTLVLGRLDYQQRHEPVVYSFKDTKRHEWFNDRKQTSVWEFPRPKKSEYHSTQKPVPLMAYPIQNSTQANGIVLDPFSGSFSTGMACEQTGRICYAMELAPKFASASIRRYVSEYGSDGVTVERDGAVLSYSDVMKNV